LDEAAKTQAGRALAGRKAALASLVSYSTGSVVSRTVINAKNGSVTLFAFDKGSELSEHTTPYDALLHVLEGEAQVTIGGNVNRVGQGEAMVLPAGRAHEVRAPRRFKMLLVMIRSG